jgi:glycine/D-amino acid oxidase-like deaminating enzyme
MKAEYYSFWEKQAFFEDIDVIIVGSGIVGLSSAYFIKSRFPQWKIMVVESGVLPHGATTRNAGFSCFGSLSELVEDLKTYGEEEMLNVVEKRWEGLKLYKVYTRQAQ